MHPGKRVVVNEGIRGVEVVELAAEPVFLDILPVGPAASLVVVDAVEVDDREVAGAEIAQPKSRGPIALLGYRGTRVAEAVEGNVEDVQKIVGDRP